MPGGRAIHPTGAHRGPLTEQQTSDSALVAEAAAVSLLDLLTTDLTGQDVGGPVEDLDDLTSWARIEVYQATGMLIGQLEVSPTEALVRLRAYAYSHELTAAAVAHLVVSRELRMER